MTYSIKNAFEYKLIGIILYFFSSLAGLSIIFLFPPRNLLFKENSEEENIKLNLYKNFAKNIYENINTPLIKNLTLTEDNESCPENFELLITKNQYQGNFTKIYGNKSICIERFKNEEYSFKHLLKISNYNNQTNKNLKECGKLIKDSNIVVYVPKEMICPLNNIEINSLSRAKKFGNNYFKMGPEDQYLTPIYGNNSKNPIITNIIITNNIKLCLEKENNINKLPCEFPDNNKCFIDDNYEQIYNLVNSDNFKLNPANLAKWNLPNDKNINHFYCKNDLIFHIFSHGYINFTETNLKRFEEEFPSNDFSNNPLYKTYKAFNSSKNIDNFFYLISYNLFICSLIHFIFQIMLYYGKKGIRNIYIRNGIILFVFKLLSLYGMIVNYYCYYLKIEKIYLIMIDKPRKKLLESYTRARIFFITKIIIICLIGFCIICIDLIIFVFTVTIQWGVEFNIVIENNFIPNENNHIILNDKKSESFEEPNFSYNPKLKTEKPPINIPVQEKPKNIKLNKTSNQDEIILHFIYKKTLTEYLISIGKNEPFKNVVKKLEENYLELKKEDMRVFTYESNIINQEKTIIENGLTENMKIFII